MAPCFLFAVAVLLAFQGGRAADDTDGLPSELVTLNEHAEKVISSVESAAGRIIGSLEDLAKNETAKIEDNAKTFEQGVLNDIQTLKESSKAESAGAGKCFIGAPQAVAELVENVTAGALACVTEQVQEGMDIVAKLNALASEANATYVEAVDKFTDCQSDPLLERPICDTEAVGEAGVTETKLAAEVAAEVAKGDALLLNFPVTAGACEVKVFAAAPGEAAAAVLDGIQTCLASFPDLPLATTAQPAGESS